MNSRPKSQPVLLVYKQILPGDMRKLLAEANDSATGGGARDLRLPWRDFRQVMNRIFTEPAIGKGGKEIRVATITYKTEQGTLGEARLEYWPPTNARPNEDRVARIHASPALGGRLPDEDKGRVFVLFIKWSDGDITCAYAYEDQLRHPRLWAPGVRDAMLRCIAGTDETNANRVRNKVPIQGYIDFVDGNQYCYGG